MSGFDGIGDFRKKITTQPPRLLAEAGARVLTGMKTGDAVTGAKGQPVDTSNLLNSFILEFPTTTEAVVQTNVAYAPDIEDGVGPHGPLTLRSEVGGFHSAKTIASNFDKLMADVGAGLA